MAGELNPAAWMVGKEITYKHRRNTTTYEAEIIEIIDDSKIKIRFEMNNGHYGEGYRDLNIYEITAVAL